MINKLIHKITQLSSLHCFWYQCKLVILSSAVLWLLFSSSNISSLSFDSLYNYFQTTYVILELKHYFPFNLNLIRRQMKTNTEANKQADKQQ